MNHQDMTYFLQYKGNRHTIENETLMNNTQ